MDPSARTYWANYDRCLNRVAAQARTVDTLIAILNEHYAPSAGEAFFPDGADRDLRSTLLENGWRVQWSRARYWFAMCEPEGAAGITFTEGDVDRGVGIPGQGGGQGECAAAVEHTGHADV